MDEFRLQGPLLGECRLQLLSNHWEDPGWQVEGAFSLDVSLFRRILSSPPHIGRSLFLPLIILLAAVPCLADGNLPFGIAAKGEVGLGIYPGAAFPGRYAYGDVDISEEAGAVYVTSDYGVFIFSEAMLRAERGRLGIDAGVFGYVGRYHETYAAVTWDFSSETRVSLGFPQPAYDKFASSALLISVPSIALNQVGYSRSEATTGAMFRDDYLPYGLLVETSDGPVAAAVSVHHVPGPSADILGAGLSYGTSDWQVSGALELSTESDATEMQGKIGTFRQFGSMAVGAGLYWPVVNGGSTVAEISASYEPVPRLRLSGLIALPSDSDDSVLLGVSGDYDLSAHARLNLTAAGYQGSDVKLGSRLVWQF